MQIDTLILPCLDLGIGYLDGRFPSYLYLDTCLACLARRSCSRPAHNAALRRRGQLTCEYQAQPAVARLQRAARLRIGEVLGRGDGHGGPSHYSVAATGADMTVRTCMYPVLFRRRCRQRDATEPCAAIRRPFFARQGLYRATKTRLVCRAQRHQESRPSASKTKRPAARAVSEQAGRHVQTRGGRVGDGGGHWHVKPATDRHDNVAPGHGVPRSHVAQALPAQAVAAKGNVAHVGDPEGSEIAAHHLDLGSGEQDGQANEAQEQVHVAELEGQNDGVVGGGRRQVLRHLLGGEPGRTADGAEEASDATAVESAMECRGPWPERGLTAIGAR